MHVSFFDKYIHIYIYMYRHSIYEILDMYIYTHYFYTYFIKTLQIYIYTIMTKCIDSINGFCVTGATNDCFCFQIKPARSTIEASRIHFMLGFISGIPTELGYICQLKKHVQWQRKDIFQKIEHGNLLVVATKKGLDLPQPTWSTAVILCRPRWRHPTEKGPLLPIDSSSWWDASGPS